MKKSICRFSFAACAVLALSLTLGSGQAKAAGEEETVNKGVLIGTTDVSGMTAREAEDAVEKEAKKELENNVTLTVGSSKVTATADELGVGWSNREVVSEAMGLGKSGNIVKRYKDNKDLEHKKKTFAIKYEADKKEIKSFLKSKKEELDCEAQDGSLTRENGEFVIEPGVVGVELDVEKSADTVYEFMNNTWKGDGGTIQLEANEQKPRGTQEELSQVKDVLGTATTYYGSTYQRNTNIEVGAQRLNGTVLYPGDSFSVTAAVSPFTAENGYELAPSYESGKVVDSYGGGICQVSTTLYNALLKSELEILERHNHTMIVTYVDPSKDAAIAEGLMDLQFANNTDYPIYIEGYGYGGELTFTVYGKEYRSPDRTVEYVSETTNTTEPEGVKLYPKADADVGYLSQTQNSHTGVEAQLWKIVTENGETTRTQVNSSTYQAVPVSYEVGINSSDPNVVAQIQTAIANNDLQAVQTIIAGGASGTGNGSTDQNQSESDSNQDTSGQTTAPTETQATETQATDPPSSESDGGGGEGGGIIDPPEPEGMANATG